MWREMMSGYDVPVEFSDPASTQAVDAVAARTGQPVPEKLRQLLLETNGVTDDYGTDIVWSAERIAEDNAHFRSDANFRELYQSFDDLLFFGDNGGGDQFAFVSSATDGAVVVWDHEDDSRRTVAPSLDDYLERALRSDGEDWYREDDEEA